ncbi:unnamed protein product [Laminaria digitata]
MTQNTKCICYRMAANSREWWKICFLRYGNVFVFVLGSQTAKEGTGGKIGSPPAPVYDRGLEIGYSTFCYISKRQTHASISEELIIKQLCGSG